MERQDPFGLSVVLEDEVFGAEAGDGRSGGIRYHSIQVDQPTGLIRRDRRSRSRCMWFSLCERKRGRHRKEDQECERAGRSRHHGR